MHAAVSQTCAYTHTYIQKGFKHPREWESMSEMERGEGGKKCSFSLLLALLWWQHMTSPPFRPEEEETRRQSTGIETQRMSLAAATAGCWYNMAAALVVTGAPNLLNKRKHSVAAALTPWRKISGLKRREKGRREAHRKKMGTGRESLKAKSKLQRTLKYYLAQNRDYTDYLSRK